MLPAKHFAPLGPNGELLEIDESQIPGTTGQNEQWMVDNQGRVAIGQEQHHAIDPRHLKNGEGEERQYLNEHGVPTRETTWIHQPTFDTGKATNHPSRVMSNGTAADHSRAISGNTLVNEPTPAQQDLEKRGELAVEAGRARGATAPSHEITPESQSNAKFGAKSRSEQEHDAAAAAVLAARRAAGHVPGGFD